jgi:hypothetical protein
VPATPAIPATPATSATPASPAAPAKAIDAPPAAPAPPQPGATPSDPDAADAPRLFEQPRAEALPPAHLTAPVPVKLGPIAAPATPAPVAESTKPAAPVTESGEPEATSTSAVPVPQAPRAASQPASHDAGQHDPGTRDERRGARDPQATSVRARAAMVDASPDPAVTTPQAPAPRPQMQGPAHADTRLEAPVSMRAIDDARFEPIRRAADQVTLQFQGEGGLEGRVRITLRGEAVHASILSADEETLSRLGGEAGSLKRALGEQGFSNAKITVHDLRTTSAAPAPSQQGAAKGEDDRRHGEPQRRSGQGRDARQGGDSAKDRRSSRDERRSE